MCKPRQIATKVPVWARLVKDTRAPVLLEVDKVNHGRVGCNVGATE